MPPHGLTPIPARPVPAVQARKESRPLALDEDGSQQLEPPKAKPRGPPSLRNHHAEQHSLGL